MKEAGQAGDMVVIIVGDNTPLAVLEKEPQVTGPEKVKLDSGHNKRAKDLLGVFVEEIEFYLSEHDDEGTYGEIYGRVISRPSATTLKVSINVDGICDYDEYVGDLGEVRKAFFEELPNIISIYEKAGWEATFEDNEKSTPNNRDGCLVLTGEVAPSSYRKLLDGVKLTTPEAVEQMIKS